MARMDSEQRRKILEAAVAVFAERGLEGAPVRAVAQRAGVNSALLYYYFTDKEALFAEAVRLVMSDFLAEIRASPPAQGGAARVARLMGVVFHYYSRYPDRQRLMALALSRHEELLGKHLAEFARSGPLPPLAILAEGVQMGELKPIHPLVAWRALLGASIFTLFMQDMPHGLPGAADLPSLAEQQKQLTELFASGLVAGKEKTKAARVVRRQNSGVSRGGTSKSAK